MTRSGMLLLAGIVTAAFLCTGCQEKFTRQRYETIVNNMSELEVEKMLGEPEAKFSDSWSYIRRDPGFRYKAVIKFKDGVVVDKAWYGPGEMGDHPDSKLDGDEGDGSKIIIERKTETVVE